MDNQAEGSPREIRQEVYLQESLQTNLFTLLGAKAEAAGCAEKPGLAGRHGWSSPGTLGLGPGLSPGTRFLPRALSHPSLRVNPTCHANLRLVATPDPQVQLKARGLHTKSRPWAPVTEESRPLFPQLGIQARIQMLLTRGLLRTPRVWGEMGFGVKRPGRPGTSFLSPLSLSSTAHQQGSRPAPWVSQYRGDGEHPRRSITQTLTLVVHEPPAELLERASVAHGPQRAVELVIGHHQILGVPGHIYDLQWRGRGGS